MQSDIKLTRTQPQRMVTDWPSVNVMPIVVLRPNGTAMMAKDLTSFSRPVDIVHAESAITYSPRTLSMLRFRGSSEVYPIFANAASALGSTELHLPID